jgi:hypothetical protein
MKVSHEWLRVGLVCAAFMVAPGAFAQHGGGGGGHAGGGGGGHYSGGGGGFAPPASHSSSGNASHGTSSSSASASHGTASTSAPTNSATGTSNGGNAANPNGGGHWWNGGHKASTAATPARPVEGTTAMRSTGRPLPIFGNPRGRGYYPYYPYGYGFYGYPYYGGGFYGFGFGGPCDPFFGCFGFGGGYGFGGGFGYGYGSYGGFGLFGGGGGGDMSGWTYSSQGNAVGSGAATSGGDYTLDAGGANGNDATVAANPADANGTADATGPTVTLNDAASAPAAPAAPAVTTVLYMRDGSSFAVSDYWLAGGKLHYVTSYGGENSTDLGKLDIQRTVDENAKQGGRFALKSGPGAVEQK